MATVQSQRLVGGRVLIHDLTSEELLVLAIILPAESRRVVHNELDRRAARAEISAILSRPPSRMGRGGAVLAGA